MDATARKCAIGLISHKMKKQIHDAGYVPLTQPYFCVRPPQPDDPELFRCLIWFRIALVTHVKHCDCTRH